MGSRAVRWSLVLLLLVPLLLLLDRRHGTRPGHQAEWLEAAGLRWRAVRDGSGDTTLVLLHGYGEHLLTWRGVFDNLARRYRVMAVDFPGFGASDKPDGPYSLDAMVSRLAALLDRWTEGPLILVGHSMGGEIAIRYAVQRPERVTALILIAPAGLGTGLGNLPGDLGPAGRTAIGWWESLRSFVTPIHDPGWLIEPEPMAGYQPTTDPAYRNSTARLLREFDFEALGPELSAVDQPVLLIWGRQDPVIPFETAQRFRELLPCVRFEPLSALHRPQAERPDTVASLLLDFLARPGCRD